MLRRLLLVVLLAGFTLAGLVPQGWMLNTSADGKVQMVICTGEGVQEVWVDLGSESAPPPATPGEKSTCAFAMGAAALPLLAPGLPVRLAPLLRARWDHSDFTHRSAGFHWRYDARGPPAAL